MTDFASKYVGTREFLRTYALLIRAAEMRGTVYYADVAAIFGLPAQGSHTGSVVGQVLGEVTREEREQGRPMLSAVAVSQTNNRPGSGFYGLAETYGLISPDASADEKRAFWEAERERVYKAWQD